MHSDWQLFLQQHAASIRDGLVSDFGNQSMEPVHTVADGNIIADLSALDVLEISGEDATDFLHGQFTSDVAALAVGEAQYSAWCNIQGRVIVSLLVYRSGGGYYLLLQQELTGRTLKRLQMFVLRANVTITDRSDELVRIGISGESAQHRLRKIINPAGTDTAVIDLPRQHGVPASIILTTCSHAQKLWLQLAEQAACVGFPRWSLLEMRAGIAWPGEAGSETFLPQSLNLDLIGGLSFDKGCYPGQEIIARMHFRGKLKQRLFLAEVPLQVPPGIPAKLYTAGIQQHVGRVVNAAMQAVDSCLLLVVVELDFVDKEAIHLGTMTGPVLTFRALPATVES